MSTGEVRDAWAALRSCPRECLRFAALGWRAGYVDGYDDLVRRIGAAGVDIARAASEAGVWARPRHGDLEARRAAEVAECSRRCGRCSRCVRAAATKRNRERYGTDDYPGAGHETAAIGGAA